MPTDLASLQGIVAVFLLAFGGAFAKLYSIWSQEGKRNRARQAQNLAMRRYIFSALNKAAHDGWEPPDAPKDLAFLFEQDAPDPEDRAAGFADYMRKLGGSGDSA